MRQYTTPTITLTVEGIDLTGYGVYVTFQQGQTKLTIEDPTMEAVTVQQVTNTVISVPLSQLQTASFDYGKALVQVNWTDGTGSRNATDIGEIGIGINLLDQVVDNG